MRFLGVLFLVWGLSWVAVAQDSLPIADTLTPDSVARVIDSAASVEHPEATSPPMAPILELKLGKPMQTERGARQEGLIALLIVYWALFAFLRLFNYTLFQYRWRALINFNLGAQYFRDQSVFSSTLHSLYHLHFLLGMALFASYIAWYVLDGIHWPMASVVLIVLAVLISLYIIRAVLGWLLSLLFGVSDTLRFAQFYSNLSYSYLAFILMPVVTIGWFAPEPWPMYAFYAGLVVAALALLGKYYRSIQIAKEYFSIYKYHLIAYICTAEIAPVFLLIKGTGLVIPVVS